MSRAFTKERDDDPGPVVSTSPRGAYYVTAAGLKNLAADDERRGRAELVQVDRNVVGFAATVTVRDERGKEMTFAIVNDEEANPAAGSIGISSSLAQAMLGKKKGESATWHRPVGATIITIESIAYASTAS